VKFLVDNQLPAALAHFLVSRGVDCQHVLDLELGDASEAEIWEHASRNDYVVISKDVDVLYLANTAPAKGRLIWSRLGNCRKQTLLSAVEQMWPKIEAELKAGDRVIELR
jgi:predicted nuclease of predicted toxin-antitoxin system